MRNYSTPVIWGNRIFLTTAIATNPAALNAPSPPNPSGPPGSSPPGTPGFGGGTGANVEHKLVVMALDRRTGKVVWQHSPKTVAPHEGYHCMYGSFASNSPVTDGKHVYAFFGSRGVYCYDLI
jgi:outer membrane protein assembly factor BamB